MLAHLALSMVHRMTAMLTNCKLHLSISLSRGRENPRGTSGPSARPQSGTSQCVSKHRAALNGLNVLGVVSNHGGLKRGLCRGSALEANLGFGRMDGNTLRASLLHHGLIYLHADWPQPVFLTA